MTSADGKGEARRRGRSAPVVTRCRSVCRRTGPGHGARPLPERDRQGHRPGGPPEGREGAHAASGGRRPPPRARHLRTAPPCARRVAADGRAGGDDAAHVRRVHRADHPPAIGAVAIDRITARTLETLYGELDDAGCAVIAGRSSSIARTASTTARRPSAVRTPVGRWRLPPCDRSTRSSVPRCPRPSGGNGSGRIRPASRIARERGLLSPIRHQPPMPRVCSMRRSRSMKIGARSCG